MCDFMFYVNSTDGVKIAVYDYNCGGTETVLLIHGWPLSHKIYEYQIPILVRMGYRVVALDLRGFGMSDVPGCGYSYDQMATDIYQVVKRLRLWSFTLVGFSMGGAISLRYMRLFRGYGVKKLILLAAAAPCWTQRPGFPYGLTREAVDEIICQIETDRAQYAEEFSQQLFASPHSACIIDWFRQIAMSASAIGTIECGLSLRDEDGRDDLCYVHVPTVIIHGEKDVVVSNDLAEIQHECINGSRLYTLQESGHGIMYDELEKFNDIFLHAVEC